MKSHPSSGFVVFFGIFLLFANDAFAGVKIKPKPVDEASTFSCSECSGSCAGKCNGCSGCPGSSNNLRKSGIGNFNAPMPSKIYQNRHQ